MEMKKALVLFGLLGVFASGFGAESNDGVKPLPMPSMEFLMKGAAEGGAVEEGSQAAIKKSGKNGPLNAILLLVDELYQSEIAQLENRDEFPVHGRLETCPAVADHSSASNCDCDERLESSIASLISSARNINMSTSFYEVYSNPSDPRSRLIYQRQEPWLSKIESRSDEEKAKIGSKLKNTFLRNFIDKLKMDREPFVYRSDLEELTSSVLKELSLERNQHGHLVIMRTGLNGLSNVLELLKRYVSTSNVLTIVVSYCPLEHPNHVVPFFARGQSSEQLTHENLKRLYELPATIQAIVQARVTRDAYYGDHERNKREVDLASCGTEDSDDDADLLCIGKALNKEFGTCNETEECITEAMKAVKQHIVSKLPTVEGDGGKKSGQDNISTSKMIVVTAITATITYALKF